MTEPSIAKLTIDSIRNKKFNLNPNTEVTERIKLLQHEMVKLSFENNRKDDISIILNEINRLRELMKKTS